MSHSPSTLFGARAFSLVSASVLAGLVAVPACSSSTSSLGLTGGTSGSGGSGASAGSNATIALGGRAGGASSGGAGNNLAGSGASTSIVVSEAGAAGANEASEGGAAGAAGVPNIDPNEACAESTATVEAVPSILQLVVDTSGSMDWPPGWAPASPDDSKPPGATKWEITRDALKNAVDSLDDGTALGANFFPDTTEDDPDSLCLRNEVGLPIAVLGSATSKQRAACAAALDAVIPNGATPTEGAYLYGLELLGKTKLPGNQFVLLITDGTPTCTLDCECTENNLPVDSGPLIDDAKNALADGIRTFVIGSPGSEDTRSVLSALAREGGTGQPGCSDDGPDYCHLDMTTEPDLATGLAGALDEVAASLRSCEYPLPPPPDNRTLDPGLVNVLYTPSGGKTKTIARDPSKSDCNQGWQYTADGQNITLCGDACAAAQADPGAQVQILLGCKTVTVEPR
ncbi:MAG TPA: vWA domain-containing protein [Polyangiaceae bacterium]|nr:vWA domain-containing protein [Polyangiaceae bacterium]